MSLITSTPIPPPTTRQAPAATLLRARSSPTGSALDGLGFAHPSLSRQLAWPNRVHLRCGLGVSHSVAPDHASRHRPYSVLLVLSRFNNAGLSPAVISAPWRTRAPVPRRRASRLKLRYSDKVPIQRRAFLGFHGCEGPQPPAQERLSEPLQELVVEATERQPVAD